MHTSREEIEVVAASLCNTFNGGIAWDFMTAAVKHEWRSKAEKFGRELVRHEWCIIAADDLPPAT